MNVEPVTRPYWLHDFAGLGEWACPKCGSSEYRLHYRKDAHCSYGEHSTPLAPDCCRLEHFHRVCQVCRYQHFEVPADAGSNS